MRVSRICNMRLRAFQKYPQLQVQSRIHNYHTLQILRRTCATSAREAREERIKNRKAQLKDEEEIDLVSPTGFLVMGFAALMFAAIWKIDQEKSKGFHGSYASAFTSFFGGSSSQEDFLKKIEKHGAPERIPDDWGAMRLTY